MAEAMGAPAAPVIVFDEDVQFSKDCNFKLLEYENR